MPSLPERAVERREELRRIIAKFYEPAADPDPEVEARIRGPPAPSGVCVRHAAEDGGSALVDLEAFTIYMVKAWASGYETATGRGGGCAYREWVVLDDADVGVVVPYAYAEERVRIYRETLEAGLLLKLALSADTGAGLILWDGSLAPLVAGRRPGSRRTPLREARSAAVERLGEGVHDEIASRVRREPLAAVRVVQEYLEKRPGRLDLEELRDGDADWIAYLEWYGKLVVLKEFLEEAWRRGFLVAFIAKTSRSSSLLGRVLPDVYYLRRARPVEPFATEPFTAWGFEELRGLRAEEVRGPFFPEDAGLDEFYRRELVGLGFYTRLSSGAPVLRVDVAVRAEWASSQEDVEQVYEAVLGDLASLPKAEGYPLALRVAHEHARVGEAEKRGVLEVLGLSLERGGRVVLQW